MPQTPLFNNILLLEDDPSHAILIERTVKHFTHTLIKAVTVQDALAKLDSNETDLIISDLHLPDVHDSAFIEQFSKKCPQSPIIVLTSSTSLDSAVDAMKRGAKDYIVKSFDQTFRDALSVTLQRTAANIQLEKERRRLLSEMAVLRIAIENSNEGLAVLTTSGQIVYANSSFHDYISQWGGTTDSIDNLLSEEIIAKGKNVIENLKGRLADEDDSVWSTELSLKEDKNHAFQLSITLLTGTNILDPNSPRGVIWIKDISDVKTREKFQREILSTTTHDLKGPLGAILLSTELLMKPSIGQEKAKELTLRINASATNALNLIDEMLSARRIQEGNYILKPIPHPLNDLLDETYQGYMNVAQAKGINLCFEQCDLKFLPSYDKLAMLRVLSNLISNAIKFTPRDGTITLTARQDDDEYTISVKDSGSGMEPHEVKRLFERFSRLNRHNEISGTGLGLFVVKSLVTAHGGRIDVQSSVGSGTTFSVTLPIQPPVNANGELLALDFSR